MRAWLATHHGVISRQEALRLGMTARQVASRVRTGAWTAQGRGVYRLAGSPGEPLGDLRAAVVACGRHAVASHRSAAWMWGMVDEATPPTVTVPHARVLAVEGVRVVRTRIATRVVVRHGIACTDALRTILDCAAALGPQEIDEIVDRALARRLTRVGELAMAVERSTELRRHPGRRPLAERLARRGVTGGPAPSVLESRMARLLAGADLPAPKAEVVWGPQRRYRLDFAYPSLRLVVEVDGFAFHFTPEQQRSDNRRSNTLAGAGWTVLRYNWWDVTHDPERVAGEIQAAYQKLAA